MWGEEVKKMKDKGIEKSSNKKGEGKNKKSNAKKVIFIIFLLFLLLFISGISVTPGSAPVTVWEAYSAIFHRFFPDYFSTTWLADICVWHLRLPRIVFGIVAGIGLGVAGAVFQGILRNPLASPYTLGITSGAGFGAALAIFLGACASSIEGYFIIGIAFIFAFLTSLFILYLANRIGATPLGIIVVVIVGIGMIWLFTSLRSLILYFCEAEAVKEIWFWSAGSLGRASWDKIVFHVNLGQVSIPLPGPVPAVLVVCCILLLISAPILKLRDFDTIGVGFKSENSPDVKIKHVRTFIIAIASLLVASTVSFTGTIAFIGLIAPHIAYVTVGKDNKFLLPVSGLLGAILLVGSDTVARRIVAPIFIPVGIITSLIGVPLFICLLIKMIFRLDEMKNR